MTTAAKRRGALRLDALGWILSLADGYLAVIGPPAMHRQEAERLALELIRAADT